MDPTIRLPFLDAKDAPTDWKAAPAVPRDAASVILVRDGLAAGRGSIELHLLRRHSKMPFAPEMLVFPGGGVDERDRGTIAPWAGPTAEQWAATLGVDDAESAAAIVTAAVRETFEETGVLLAGDHAGSAIDATAAPEWETDRRRLTDKQVSLPELLEERHLVLRSDLLRAWSQWTTPTFERRRYRTWFFLARVPKAQEARDVSGETSSSGWASVGDALRAAERGTGAMFPPQYSMCLELFTFADAAAAMTSPLPVEHISPTLETDDDGSYLGLPPRLVELGRNLASEIVAEKSV